VRRKWYIEHAQMCLGRLPFLVSFNHTLSFIVNVYLVSHSCSRFAITFRYPFFTFTRSCIRTVITQLLHTHFKHEITSSTSSHLTISQDACVSHPPRSPRLYLCKRNLVVGWLRRRQVHILHRLHRDKAHQAPLSNNRRANHRMHHHQEKDHDHTMHHYRERTTRD